MMKEVVPTCPAILFNLNKNTKARLNRLARVDSGERVHLVLQLSGTVAA